MKVESMVEIRPDCIGGTLFGGFVALLAVVTLLLVQTEVVSAGSGKWNVFDTKAVSFESIDRKSVV